MTKLGYLKRFALLAAVLAAAAVGGKACTGTEYHKAKLAEVNAKQEEEFAKRAAEAAIRAKPRIVTRSDDGCDVYAFNLGDRWRYFTRCATKTTTDNSYESSNGRFTTTIKDSITTETVETPATPESTK